MGGLPVEGFLSLSSNIWKSTLTAKDSMMVCAFCLESEPHEHSVIGKIVMSRESCSVQLELGGIGDESDVKIVGVDESGDLDYGSGDESFDIHDEDDEELMGLFAEGDVAEITEAETVKTEQPDFYDDDFVHYDLGSVVHDSPDPLSLRELVSTPVESCETQEATPKQIHRLKQPAKQIHRIRPIKVELKPIQPKEFPCDMCDKKFKTQRNLAIHFQCHSSERPFQCDICEKDFKYSTALKVHRSAIHGVDIRSHVCELCGVHVHTPNHLRYHMKAKHSDSVLICQHCGKEFKVASSLNRHIRLHYGIKSARPQQCTICGLTYSRSDTLRAHMRTHTEGIHAHSCDTCGENFGSFKKLRAHAQQHRFIRIFQNATKVNDS